jgi:hypothetical protein
MALHEMQEGYAKEAAGDRVIKFVPGHISPGIESRLLYDLWKENRVAAIGASS